MLRKIFSSLETIKCNLVDRKWLLLFTIYHLTFTIAFARYPDTFKAGIKSKSTEVSTRSDCAQGASKLDMEINNVRATLLSSGDVWWDLNIAGYVVPKVDRTTGALPVSSIFAGAVWLGGLDPAGNLKVAVQTYRDATHTDFWPGPLTQNGTTSSDVCQKWDQHFEVFGSDVDTLLKKFAEARQLNPNNPVIDCNSIPISIKGWPATGNPYFFEVHRFSLPKDAQGLAKFHDENGDGLYDPCTGDYPTIDIKGCNIDVHPDHMVFWIYNDNGGVHTQSARSTAIQMEVQVQAFAYKSNDELNDMTFQRYKLINRAKTDIDSTFFAMWIDFDLGCYTDDYVGCDTTRSLVYCYNQDALDGTIGCVCDRGVNTYCDKIPIIGVDYFRGPNNEFGKELGMSSFTYYNNATVGNPLAGTTDPATATEYYNYLSGSWKDGTPFTFGGSGYAPGSGGKKVKYAFIDAPNNPSGWSMCSQGLPSGDRRIIQASGPFKLKPGAVNELIVGLPWVADQKYPCPSITNMQEADDIAQSLFDNCFKIFDGPDAPDMSFVELDKEIIAVLSNRPESNNYKELYKEKGLRIPKFTNDSLYRFQGYKIYQLHDGNVGVADLENPDKSRLVGEVDVQDSVQKVYNFTPVPDPNFGGRTIFTPVLKLDGENKGIRHTFSIKSDQFATTDDKRLTNHKKYYFVAVAFAYNNYNKFDEKTAAGFGQREPYVIGRKNIGDQRNGGSPYTVLPRPIDDVNLNTVYGEGPIITRLDGVGTGNNFLNISAETLQKILDGTFDGSIVYKPGGGPINVKIVNPLDVINGQYTLTLRDTANATPNIGDVIGSTTGFWELSDSTGSIIRSERSIDKLNEQIIAKFGFSIAINQVADVGTQPFVDKTNGYIGTSIEYAATGVNWLAGIQNNFVLYNGLNTLDYIKCTTGQIDFNLDPNCALANTSPLFTPYFLQDYRQTSDYNNFFVSPAWQNTLGTAVRNNNSLANLNNVDIVYTKDKSKWSRCVVVETASPYYYDAPNGPRALPEGSAKMFDLRAHTSVGKDADANGNPKPDGDGTGMGWFPGYAVDVETGQRVNIFFGENSAFDPTIGTYAPESKGINRDMAFNPSNQLVLQTVGVFDPAYSAFLGGQHFVYVSNLPYDSCKFFRDRFTGIAARKVGALRNVTWSGIQLSTTKLLSYAAGLIPNDVTVKMRVNNPYAVFTGKGTNQSRPTYKFSVAGKAPSALAGAQTDSSLNLINIVPNPYYGYSQYEVNEFSTTIKITNLPAKSTTTIYTLDGKFIRQFKRDEVPYQYPATQQLGVRTQQITPDVEWDLKNDKGIPVASGVYLFYVDSPQGHRTLKFFAVNRAFDPSRL